MRGRRRPKPGSGPLLLRAPHPKPALTVSQDPIQRGGPSPAASPGVTDAALGRETVGGGSRFCGIRARGLNGPPDPRARGRGCAGGS